MDTVLPYKFKPITDEDGESKHYRQPFFNPERIKAFVSSSTMCMVCIWCGMCFTINEWVDAADRIGGRDHVKEMVCPNCQKQCKWHLSTFEGLEHDLAELKKEQKEALRKRESPRL